MPKRTSDSAEPDTPAQWIHGQALATVPGTVPNFKDNGAPVMGQMFNGTGPLSSQRNSPSRESTQKAPPSTVHQAEWVNVRAASRLSLIRSHVSAIPGSV